MIKKWMKVHKSILKVQIFTHIGSTTYQC